MARTSLTRNEMKAALRKKRRQGLLPPQVCPACRADLSDPKVPDRYAAYAAMFGRAHEVAVDADTAVWVCPDCGTAFDRHAKPDDLVAP